LLGVYRSNPSSFASRRRRVKLLGNARGIKGYEKPNCVNCAHHVLYEADPVLIYSSPKHRCTIAIDLVTGEMVETDCYAMRHHWGACGPHAERFEKAAANGGNTTADPPPPVKPGMSIGLIALLVLSALAIPALAYWAYEQETYQPSVTKTGEVSVKDGSCCVTARTRLLATGGRSLWQVEVSPGDWRDCGNDCEKALRRTLAE